MNLNKENIQLSNVVRNATLINGNILIVKFGCLLSQEKIKEIQEHLQKQTDSLKVIVMDLKCDIEVRKG